MICAFGFYQSAIGNTCVYVGDSTNQVPNCMNAYLNNSLSGNSDGKCYACANDYVLNYAGTDCVLTVDTKLTNTCRQFADEGVVCGECKYPYPQVNSDNSWCFGKVLGIGFVSVIALLI